MRFTKVIVKKLNKFLHKLKYLNNKNITNVIIIYWKFKSDITSGIKVITSAKFILHRS